MPLVLTEEENLLAESANRLFSRAAPVSAFRDLRDGGAAERYAPELWAEMAAAGFAGILIPEELGGTGFGYAASGLIFEQIGQVLAASPLMSAALASEILLRDGNAAQKELLADVATGKLIIAFALDEKSRHQPTHFATHARMDGPGYRLSGTKRLVLDGGNAAKLIIAASTEQGPTLFLLDSNTPGVSIKPLNLVDSRNAVDISLSDVRLVAEAVIGAPGEAAATIDRVLDVGRALLSAELLGIAEESFSRTITYLKEREQFGVKIGSFQALQHRASRMYANLDLARGVVLKALRALDENDRAASALASLAKATLTRTARAVLNEALQMHGGIGVTDDFDIGLFFKRARVAGDTFGDDYFHKERLARLVWHI